MADHFCLVGNDQLLRLDQRKVIGAWDVRLGNRYQFSHHLRLSKGVFLAMLVQFALQLLFHFACTLLTGFQLKFEVSSANSFPCSLGPFEFHSATYIKKAGE